MTHVFIDGQAGTTGLQIRERLAARDDVTLLEIPESSRKDAEVRRQYLNEADVVILCLPDDAAREALGPHIAQRRARAGREHGLSGRGRLGLRAARARRGPARQGPRRGAGQQSGMLSHRLRPARPPPRRRRCRAARCTPVVPRDLGILGGWTPAHRALRGTRGGTPGVALARAARTGSTCATSTSRRWRSIRESGGPRCSRRWSGTSRRECS